DFDNVWKWLGYNQKGDCRVVLTTYFNEGFNYRVIRQAPNNPQGGRPVEKIMLSIRTFKKLCIKAFTKKANQILEYYINLEEINMEYISIQAGLKRKQQDDKLQQYEVQLKQQQEYAEQEKIVAIAIEREKQLLKFYKTKKVSGIYFLVNISLQIAKVGSSNDVYKRVMIQKSGEFKDGFKLECIIDSDKYLDLENIIKQKYKNSTYNGHTEIIKYQDYTEMQEIYKIADQENKKLLLSNSNNELDMFKLKIEYQKDNTENLKAKTEYEKANTENIKARIEYIRVQNEMNLSCKKDIQSPEVNNCINESNDIDQTLIKDEEPIHISDECKTKEEIKNSPSHDNILAHKTDTVNVDNIKWIKNNLEKNDERNGKLGSKYK